MDEDGKSIPALVDQSSCHSIGLHPSVIEGWDAVGEGERCESHWTEVTPFQHSLSLIRFLMKDLFTDLVPLTSASCLREEKAAVFVLLTI